MREEMETHIARATERFIARGMSPDDAALAARREFGNRGVVQEQARDARGGRWLESLMADLRYAFRYYARTPLSAITIILTLALGVGFSSAVFSVMAGLVRRPAPGVPDDPALVKIRGLTDVRPFARALSYPELTEYAALSDRFESVAAWTSAGVVVDAGCTESGVISAHAQFVTPNYFATLGVRLQAGRTFSQSRFDAVSPPELTAIVSHAFATARLGGVGAAIGRDVKVSGIPVTIIGVAPERFNGAVQSGWPRTIWMPLSAWQTVAGTGTLTFADRNQGLFEAIARLKRGVSPDEATAAAKVIAARADAELKAQATQTWIGSADVVRLRGIVDPTGRYGPLGPAATLAGGAALLILLVCTTTVNSLLLGAAVSRRYETGVRLAIGASRQRVVRQFLTEVALLALAGGALGMWVFGVFLKATELAQDGFDIAPDWQTTSFTMLYALFAAALCGLSPALHATRSGLSEVLKESSLGAARRSRLHRSFVVAQITVALPFMIALAAVTVSAAEEMAPDEKSALRAQILSVEFNLSAGRAGREPNRIPALIERLAAVPGVAAVVPMGGNYGRGLVSLQPPPDIIRPAASNPPPASNVFVYDVSPGYFEAVNAPIVRGREFLASDSSAAVTPIVIVERVATELFGSSDPVGQRLRGISRYDGSETALEVVGVTRMDYEVFHWQLEKENVPAFAPVRRGHEGLFLIRTTGPADPVIPSIQVAARTEAPLLPLEKIRSLSTIQRERKSMMMRVVGVVGGAGLLALVLASLGLYAMVNIAVGQRQREIGIRMALGARAREVVVMFFASGLRTALLGVAFGLPLGLAVLWFLPSVLPIQSQHLMLVPPLVIAGVVLVASLASWLPARRGARVDPMVALRTE